MAKPSKKRQRLDSTSSKAQKQKTKASVRPQDSNATLERLLDEESKDDEERRLESMLFGVPYVPRGKAEGKRKEQVADGGLIFDVDDEGSEEEDGGRIMANLLDSDVRVLFFLTNNY